MKLTKFVMRLAACGVISVTILFLAGAGSAQQPEAQAAAPTFRIEPGP